VVVAWQFSEGLEFCHVLFAGKFLLKYLNKVSFDRFICFAKICEFIFACIEYNSLNLGKKEAEG